jgi:replicative DNA helicase
MTDEIFQQEAETAVLSIILKFPDKFYELMNLQPHMFSSSISMNLYVAITDMISQKLVPETNLLVSFLGATDRLQAVGGKEYITYLISQEYAQENLKKFEEIIINSYKARSLMSLSSKIPSMVLTEGDIDATLGNIRTTLDKLIEASGGENTATFLSILKETTSDLELRVANPGIKGITTGLKRLDIGLSGLNGGDLVIVAGRPGAGKTTLMVNKFAVSQAIAGLPVLVFSLEMRRTALVEKILSEKTGIPLTSIRLGMISKEQIDTVYSTIEKIKSLPLHIDSNYSSNLNYMLSTIRKYKKLYNIRAAYVDYLQLLSERTSDSTNELGRICRGFKLLANELDIPIILGSQLNRGVELREDKRPALSDLRQSGNIEEDADIVLGLYRDALYTKNQKTANDLELIILKQRFGPTGTVLCGFEGDTGKITDR